MLRQIHRFVIMLVRVLISKKLEPEMGGFYRCSRLREQDPAELSISGLRADRWLGSQSNVPTKLTTRADFEDDTKVHTLQPPLVLVCNKSL
ncbi:hypothetical protein PoB_006135200 [Plakobranchus ocellatus]|uniref:Uncharacterized protein n=1 Tax=Plakobranchus ocellatus TaxID=259542 RepID=A0AAV4CSJ5_9GAST|nr:hypothetical protein PoB_006135200 [Plakobranchus ocellatus]